MAHNKNTSLPNTILFNIEERGRGDLYLNPEIPFRTGLAVLDVGAAGGREWGRRRRWERNMTSKESEERRGRTEKEEKRKRRRSRRRRWG